ncbi:hypothetical protein MASR2M29_05060 [Spirochaetota bacterium]
MSEHLMDVIKLLSSVSVNIAIVVFCFKLRVKKSLAALVLVGTAFLNIALDLLLQRLANPVLLALQLDTFVFCIAVVFISGGSIYGQIFFHYTQNLVSNCIVIIGLQFSAYGSPVVFAMTEALLLLYFVLMLGYAKGIITVVREFLHRPAWRILILYPLGAYYAVRLVGFELPNALFAPNTPLSLALSLLAGIIMCILSIMLGRQSLEIEAKAREARMMLASGEAYYKNLTELLEQIRIIRHDYKHELGAIKHLLKNGEIEELKKFLELPGHIDRNDIQLYCKNTVVNAVLAHYADICMQKEIALDIKAVLPSLLYADSASVPGPENEKLNNYDLCVVAGNLLENAIEASLGLPPEKRRIEINIDHNQNRIIIAVKNAFGGSIGAILDSLPVSNKKGRSGHAQGLGLKSVKALCESFNGIFMCSWDNGVFSASALVNLF